DKPAPRMRSSASAGVRAGRATNDLGIPGRWCCAVHHSHVLPRLSDSRRKSPSSRSADRRHQIDERRVPALQGDGRDARCAADVARVLGRCCHVNLCCQYGSGKTVRRGDQQEGDIWRVRKLTVTLPYRISPSMNVCRPQSGTKPSHRCHIAQRRARGFTLMETAIAMVIVGVAIVASMRLFASCSQQNSVSTRMTTAMLLAGNVREAMTGLSFNDPIFGKAT